MAITTASVTAHIHIGEILLYEIGIQDPASRPYMALTDRLALLWSCLGACKAYLANRFAKPIEDDPRFVCMSAFDIMYCFMTCLRLATLQVPGWDLALVRKELDLDSLVERQTRYLKMISERRKRRQVSGGGNKDAQAAVAVAAAREDPYDGLSRKLHHMIAVLRSELDTYSTSNSTPMDMAVTSLEDGTQDVVQDMDASFWHYFLALDDSEVPAPTYSLSGRMRSDQGATIDF